VPFSTLNVVLEVDSVVLKFLEQQKQHVFSTNSWFLAFYNVQKKEPTDYLKSELTSVKSISLNSKFYCLVVTGDKVTSMTALLFEAYRIAVGGQLIIKQIGFVKDKQLQYNNSDFIWERRQDLMGHEFKIVALPNFPFITFNEQQVKSLGNQLWAWHF
jgi:hypothetical protein